MKNIEKYKNFVLSNLNCCKMETDLRRAEGKTPIDCERILCEDCKESFFKWFLEEYKGPILEDAEKEYLSAVLRPFRKDIVSISKYSFTEGYSEKREYIKFSSKSQSWILPSFKAGTMYKGMKTHKEYTLEELGL